MAFMFCGAAGNRTPVQTRKPLAFYMLSYILIFVKETAYNNLIFPYSELISHYHPDTW